MIRALVALTSIAAASAKVEPYTLVQLLQNNPYESTLVTAGAFLPRGMALSLGRRN